MLKRRKKYMKNNDNKKAKFVIQANWFCLLGFLLCVIQMVEDLIVYDVGMKPVIDLGGYLVTVIIWLLVWKCNKLSCFMDVFNTIAPSCLILGGLIYYLVPIFFSGCAH